MRPAYKFSGQQTGLEQGVLVAVLKHITRWCCPPGGEHQHGAVFVHKCCRKSLMKVWSHLKKEVSHWGQLTKRTVVPGQTSRGRLEQVSAHKVHLTKKDE